MAFIGHLFVPGSALTPQHQHLQNQLQLTCEMIRNPQNPPASPLAVIEALNLCLAPTEIFFDAADNEGDCALTFLGHLLDEAGVSPDYLVSHMERGNCQNCHLEAQQVTS